MLRSLLFQPELCAHPRHRTATHERPEVKGRQFAISRPLIEGPLDLAIDFGVATSPNDGL